MRVAFRVLFILATFRLKHSWLVETFSFSVHMAVLQMNDTFHCVLLCFFVLLRSKEFNLVLTCSLIVRAFENV